MKAAFIQFVLLLVLPGVLRTQEQDMYPLHVGDKWFYFAPDSWEADTLVVTGDTLMPNGKTYFKIENMREMESYFVFQRVSGLSVFSYSTSRHEEFLLYDFSRPEAHLISTIIEGSDTTDIRGGEVAPEYDPWSGSMRKQWGFLYIRRHDALDIPYFVDIREGYGVYRNGLTEALQPFNQLNGASINGQAFGDATAVDAYPLHIGDKWFYSGWNAPNEDKIVAGDTMMSNGKRYFRIERMVDPTRVEFERVSEDSVFKYDTLTHTEYPYYHLAVPQGGWHSGIPRPGGDTLDILSRWSFVSYDSLSWTARRFWEFIISQTRFISDASYTLQIKEGFGVYRIDDDFRSRHVILRGAIIDGKAYGDVTAVDDGMEVLPRATYLYQNYPNPFNGTTRIEFELPARAFVSLNVFNILGEHVATLIAGEERNAGENALSWETDGLPSGVYYYTLRTGTISETKRLMLVK